MIDNRKQGETTRDARQSSVLNTHCLLSIFNLYITIILTTVVYCISIFMVYYTLLLPLFTNLHVPCLYSMYITQNLPSRVYNIPAFIIVCLEQVKNCLSLTILSKQNWREFYSSLFNLNLLKPISYGGKLYFTY